MHIRIDWSNADSKNRANSIVSAVSSSRNSKTEYGSIIHCILGERFLIFTGWSRGVLVARGRHCARTSRRGGQAAPQSSRYAQPRAAPGTRSVIFFFTPPSLPPFLLALIVGALVQISARGARCSGRAGACRSRVRSWRTEPRSEPLAALSRHFRCV